VKNSNTVRFAITIALAAALSACGGGGSDSSDSSTPTTTTTGSTTTTTTTTSTDSSLVTTAPASTYPSGSDNAIAFNLINSERLSCGFGAVTQNAALDTAAANHATYLVDRLEEDVYGSHTEDPSLSGYTGATFGDRDESAGYDWQSGGTVSEDFDFYWPGTTTGYASGLVRNMFATVYHLASMVNGNRDAGVGVQISSSGYQTSVMDWESGTLLPAVQQQTTGLMTYPCNGSTGIQPHMGGTESPEPFTSLGFSSGTTVGQPLYFKAPEGSTIVLTSATLMAADGSVVNTTLYQYTDDSNSELSSNQGFVIPRASLAFGTSYTAVVAGTIDGTAFTNIFSFTTEASM
jgi:hypothetical protein